MLDRRQRLHAQTRCRFILPLYLCPWNGVKVVSLAALSLLRFLATVVLVGRPHCVCVFPD